MAVLIGVHGRLQRKPEPNQLVVIASSGYCTEAGQAIGEHLAAGL